VFLLPQAHHSYAGEQIEIKWSADRTVNGFSLLGLFFPKIQPADFGYKNINEKLTAEFINSINKSPPSSDIPVAKPTSSVDLVDLKSVAPKIKLSLPAYYNNKAFLQNTAAESLAEVHNNLSKDGYGLLLFDAYRPWYIGQAIESLVPDKSKKYLAESTSGPHHSRGGSVNVGLFSLSTGDVLDMGTQLQFIEQSYSSYPGGTTQQRNLRNVLREAMEAEDFCAYTFAWWHFDYKDSLRYPPSNTSFEEL